MRGVVYTLIAENGGEKEWDTFIQLYKKEQLHQEKDRIWRALASFKNTSLLQRTLDWSISKDIRMQDSHRILYVVLINSYGRDVAWEFIQKNWDIYKKKYEGVHGLSRIIGGLGSFTSEKTADEIKTFFAKNTVSEIERTLKQVVERIRANAQWLERQSNEVEKFLKNC